jgi:polar amino acid transport system substrate-binding protein
MNNKTIIKFIAAFVCIFTGLSMEGCAPGASDKVLRIGVDDSYPPMEYKDDKNNTIGFDVDLGSEIAKKLGMKIELISTAWDGIFQALNTNKFDCILSSVSLTEERKQNFAFTRPYIANSQVIVVAPSNNTIKSGNDLAGKKVGAQVSTTAHDSAIKLLQKIKFDLSTYDQVIQPFQDLKTGRLDAIIVDEVVARYYVTQDKSSYKVSSGKLTNEPIAICFSKDNTSLRDKIDSILDGFQKDGTMKKISEKWFTEDLTSNIDEKLMM